MKLKVKKPCPISKSIRQVAGLFASLRRLSDDSTSRVGTATQTQRVTDFFSRLLATVLLLFLATESSLLTASNLTTLSRSPLEPPPPAGLVADLDVIDFGRLLSGEIVSRTIRLSNRSEAPLTLSRILFTCGCTIPLITLPDGGTIEPDKLGDGPLCRLEAGQSCRVQLEFRSLVLTGRVARRIFFYTNDGADPTLSLPIKAEIRPAFVIEPRRIDFGRVSWTGEAIEQRIVVRSAGAGAFEIEGGSRLPPFFSWTAEPLKDAPVPTWKVTVSLDSKPPSGTQTFILHLDIKSERIRTLTLFGTAVIDEVITFEARPGGDIINFGVLRGARGTHAEVDIVNLDPAVPYEISGVLIESPQKEFVSVKLHTLEAGLRFKLFVDVAPGMVSRFFRGKIIIVSSHRNLPRKVISFKGWINQQDAVDEKAGG